ncbi:ead/Ea22-like family protein [Citrobacter youngae]|uniref:ead/Ea22-like family protein n=1 Tax=Citrobacter youngae TaxID=133448 RepID=UPI003F1CC5BD
MTALNKYAALREAANAANIASWGKWEPYKPHKGARGYEVKVGAKAVAQHCLKVYSAFIAAANPATVLALLDELEAAEKRIAELEARTVTLPDEPFYPDGDIDCPLAVNLVDIKTACDEAGVPLVVRRGK